MKNIPTEICRTHFSVGLRIGVDVPNVGAALRPCQSRSITRFSHLPELCRVNPPKYFKDIDYQQPKLNNFALFFLSLIIRIQIFLPFD